MMKRKEKERRFFKRKIADASCLSQDWKSRPGGIFPSEL